MRYDHSDHSPQAISERLDAGGRVSLGAPMDYGGIDGAITTFAIAAGALGAALSAGTIIVLGIANLIADGFSMAAASYLSAKAEHDERQRIIAVEQRHIARYPEGEREEVRQLLERKGFSGTGLDAAVETITATEERWIDFMLTEEYGLASQSTPPLSAALATFFAFSLCGAVPILPFVLGLESAALVSLAMTTAVFFLIGLAKGWATPGGPFRSALQTLAIGVGAAALAYGIGAWLSGLIGT